MFGLRQRAVAVVLAAVCAGCTANVSVTATRSDAGDTPMTAPPVSANLPDDPGTLTTEPSPGTSTPDTPNIPVSIDPDAINFGPNKPERNYDDFLLASLSDLNEWWAVVYPEVYSEAWEPLQGEVYAAYPERPDDLPGCGEPRTTYDEVRDFAAFYCGLGDFIIYDDGDRGLLAGLADNFGAGTIGIVLAHEFGHAIQQRSGVLSRNLPTVTTEQQADCFAGAWAGRAARGEGLVKFSDADVRAGLIAMLEVRDPVGIDQFTPGGHGSGFDRVGAFQTGFVQGPQRCADIIDNPLPLMPNQFTSAQDQENEGNAPFGYGDLELLGFIVSDLNLYWENDAGIDGFEPLELVSVQDVSQADCANLSPGLDTAVALCPSTGTVYINEPAALDFYNDPSFGDFSIGYLLGLAWAEAAQATAGSTLTGEERQLANDCLTGAWVQTVIPVGGEFPQPRAAGRTSLVSPGDLDEAIRTAIVIGDLGAADDVLGSPFEKIDAFRDGVIGGTEPCGF